MLLLPDKVARLDHVTWLLNWDWFICDDKWHWGLQTQLISDQWHDSHGQSLQIPSQPPACHCCPAYQCCHPHLIISHIAHQIFTVYPFPLPVSLLIMNIIISQSKKGIISRSRFQLIMKKDYLINYFFQSFLWNRNRQVTLISLCIVCWCLCLFVWLLPNI